MLGVRALHLDLKGLPPTPDRLLKLPRIATLGGYNAMLVEWEDTFPWTCDERFRAPHAYSPSDVVAFAKEAARCGVQIIPLVQCIGHMETPLKHRPDLREIPDRPEVLNVTAEGAQALVQGMVEDVLALLPEVSYFHLGGDEARTFGHHPDTAAAIQQLGRDGVYLKHVTPIMDSLSERGIRPMFWHDMMREWPTGSLQHVAEHADLCVWHYHGDPATSTLANSEVLQRFHEAEIRLWLGTAFKGADGADADLPSAENRIANAMAWMEMASDTPFVGAVATGWSRHATPGMQNEPLDAALDVLLAIGWVLRDGAAPEIAACIAALEEIGERDHFNACRDVMFRIADSRRAAWHMVVQIHQQVAMEHVDPQRAGSRILKTIRGYLDNYITDLQHAGDDMRRVFATLLHDRSIDEYLEVRIAALLAAQSDLNQRITDHEMS